MKNKQKLQQEQESTLNDLLSNPDLIYKGAINKWGHHLQLDMLVEECAELIASVNRLRRGRTKDEAVIEELADVDILIGQMRLVFDQAEIDEIKRKKLTRLAERVGLIRLSFKGRLASPAANCEARRN